MKDKASAGHSSRARLVSRVGFEFQRFSRREICINDWLTSEKILNTVCRSYPCAPSEFLGKWLLWVRVYSAKFSRMAVWAWAWKQYRVA